MQIYEFSLKRKRINSMPNNDEIMLTDGRIVKLIRKRKFEITKDKLIELLNKHPLTEIGKNFGVSGNSIKRRAILLSIEKNIYSKGNGYWTKKL